VRSWLDELSERAENFGPFRRVSNDDKGSFVDRDLLLDTAGVRNYERGFRTEREKLAVADRLDARDFCKERVEAKLGHPLNGARVHGENGWNG